MDVYTYECVGFYGSRCVGVLIDMKTMRLIDIKGIK